MKYRTQKYEIWNIRYNIYNCKNNYQKFKKLYQIIKIAKDCQSMSKFVKIIRIIEKYQNFQYCQKNEIIFNIVQNCQNKMSTIVIIVKMFVRLCLMITLIMSQRSQVSRVAFCMSKVKVTSVSQWVTRSPIELFSTAKKVSTNRV